MEEMKWVFSKPNQISLMRIALIPVFVFFLLADIPHSDYISAFIFSVLSLSDALDGYIARGKKQASKSGELLDPIADKLLISAALIFLADRIPLWMIVTIIARELVITILRFIVLPKRVVPADKLGKFKTITQTAAIIAVILNLPFSWHLMLLAVIITLFSGLVYLVKISNMLNEKILNIPNFITFMRFALLPLFAVLMLNSNLNYALVIFAIIAITDKIDGISSRVMKQVTEFGKSFDSFTDWSVFIVAFILLVSLGYIELFWILLLVFPAVVMFFSKLIFLKKQKKAPVTPIARISVAMTYITIISILMGFAYNKQILIATFIIIYFSMMRYLFMASKLYKPAKVWGGV
ncbi:CDP-diacylglycerol--glycerol-3-phosphate 3-phosphatidyltransferase [Candidatus Woesearchaeota archaeon]|nr:CDP-diacylglycerol--glycerol-3-phosphate 3-phosphatidyltransferase [Candidatus Woesearchaeota archaeon]